MKSFPCQTIFETEVYSHIHGGNVCDIWRDNMHICSQNILIKQQLTELFQTEKVKQYKINTSKTIT